MSIIEEARKELHDAKSYLIFIMNDLENARTIDRAVDGICSNALRKCRYVEDRLSALTNALKIIKDETG